MDKVVIFNGFQTVKLTQKVEGIHSKGVSSLWGSVVFGGKIVLVEKIHNEWWGRTT